MFHRVSMARTGTSRQRSYKNMPEVKRDKIVSCVVKREREGGPDEGAFVDIMYGLTEAGALYEFVDATNEWDFVTLSPEI